MNKKLAVSALFPLFLAACGGGGDGDSSNGDTEAPATPPAAVTDPVTQGSLNTASQLGLALLPGNEGSVRVYDVTADIGDTWRLTLDLATGAYSVKVLYTAYGLTDASGTFTVAANGDFTTVTGPSTTLLLDERTRTLSGSMSLGGRAATVSGTRYALPADVSVLAGNYVFAVAAHGMTVLANGGSSIYGMQATLPGTLMLRGNGTGVACALAIVNSAGKCSVPGSQSYDGITVQFATDPSNGQLTLLGTIPPATPTSAATPINLGLVRVQAGDRGQVLVLDLPPGNGLFNNSGMVSGVTYAIKQQKLSGTESDGTWTCSREGAFDGTLVVNGGKGSYTNRTNVLSTYAFTYNTFQEDDFKLTVDGLAIGLDEKSAGRGLLMLPMTNSLTLVTKIDGSAGLPSSLCQRVNG
ncbi:Uncharacterised protein [Bordetella ansorpii]|uniref:Lipoprotein n=1 Tax=Bordetella ansorpii TaxID=288768 RepID=A0A157SDB8_9BORD|nr:hypothetical protein [Bordetella ansorpii]SAI68417.1 Uncharacterised protein [Bordetella ansorpii]